jgi:hypothetical protein
MTSPFEIMLHVTCFVLGAIIVTGTLMSAIRTVVLPRGENTLITRMIFESVFRAFNLRLKHAQSYEERDRVMALYAPIGLLSLPIGWLILVVMGYTLMYRASDFDSWYEAFKMSGSSLYTLGFFFPEDTLLATILAFSEATIGLGMVALLLSYLPTIYAAFAKRETLVTLLEVRADSPPSAVALINRAHGIRGLDSLKELWTAWEVWFAEIDESHTSHPALTMFRSPQPDRSWITAAGAVLDAAALMSSTVDVPRTPEAQLCIRAGFVALRHIADFFRIQYHPDPHFPAQPISISREEFDEACEQLAGAGVPIKEDRDQAWLDFAGWRVNYDTVLLELADWTMAPYAPWSSDRGVLREPSANLHPKGGLFRRILRSTTIT